MTGFVTKNNISKLQGRIEYMYLLTITKLRIRCERELSSKENNRRILLNRDAFNLFKNLEFMEYFTKCIIHLMRQISLGTSHGHTQDCLVRCSFDLIFRYLFDLNYIPVLLSKLEEDICSDYLNLQLNIFKDAGWCLNAFVKPSTHQFLTTQTPTPSDVL